jgi:hypothetical protein
MGIGIKNLGLMGCSCGRGIQEKLIGIAWREARGEEERKRGREEERKRGREEDGDKERGIYELSMWRGTPGRFKMARGGRVRK